MQCKQSIEFGMRSIRLWLFLVMLGIKGYLCNSILDTEEPLFTDEDIIESSTPTFDGRYTAADSTISDKSYESFYANDSDVPTRVLEKKDSSSVAENITENGNSTESWTECQVNTVLPVKGTGEEVKHSLKILVMLFVIAICFMQIYFLLRSKFHYVPESTVVVLTGALFGAFFDSFSGHLPGDLQNKEAFDPTTFFLFLLPPIMYESAYNLHKGNFFRNFGSIFIFAVFGTAISAFVIGGSIFVLGQAKVVYELTFTESFAYGCFLSAVDPVATLAVFQALDVDPVLNMLVIGESILNDAVAIVLANTVWEASLQNAEEDSISYILLRCATRFTTIFLCSAGVGLLSGFLAAFLFKHVDLRKYPWMEFGMMLIFIYTPYCVAEVLELSAIMAILFNGIVMSHYTHLNLSRLVQNIMQVTLRSMALIAETCVFAYLGVSIFSYQRILDWPFVFASIILCLIARAINVFPLSFIVNMFREREITPKMMFIMWFSAIRGAVTFALSLRFDFEEKKRNVIITATLIIVLFTTIFFGCGTMPFLKLLQRKEEKCSHRDEEICPSEVCLLKTEKMGTTIDAERLSDVNDVDLLGARNFFLQIDAKYLTPFFTRNQNPLLDSDAESKTSDCSAKNWY